MASPAGGRRRGRAAGTGRTVAEVDRLALIATGLRTAAARFGTPAYVTDAVSLIAAGDELRAAFPDPWIRQYSVKANDVPGLISVATSAADAGANVVSRGEWALARRAGVANAAITFEGIGKTDADLRAAVRASATGAGLHWIAVESEAEAGVLAAMAKRAGLGRGGRPALEVLFRLNPDVVPETHAGLAVGSGGSKFGMPEAELAAALEMARASRPALRPRGIHLHVGSQLGAIDAWRDGARRALATLALLGGGDPDFDTLDLGGGFPVGPIGEPSPRPERFAREVAPLLEALPVDRRPGRLAIEPGRFLVARAGWIVARILHVRDRGGPQIVIDAGMTELIRPALYGARHGIVALTSLGAAVDGPPAEPGEPADVHGPVCESTDALGSHALPPLRRGDLVAIRDAGAYGASLSSTYNGRPRPPQVLLDRDGTLTLLRRRGTIVGLG